MFRREQFKVLRERLLEPRNKIQVIAGPRQVGKSTLVKQVLKDINLPFTLGSGDDVDKNNSLWIPELWDSARARLKLSGKKEHILVIDEVHKINNWSEQIKRLWDEDSFNDLNLKLVILGSSRLLLKDGLTESLAGRFEMIRMPHWSFKEMNEAFGWTIEQFVYFGGYPGSAEFIKDETRWRNYIKDSIITPAIAKDILLTKTIYKPELMKRLFELGASYSGEELSFNKILGQLQDKGNVTTLANYLTTLGEAQLLGGLQKFSNAEIRKYNSSPKMMVYNTALLSALMNKSFEKIYTSPSEWGRWVESSVGAHLLNHADENDLKIYYWRHRNDEVDFIMEKNDQLIGIEVKSGRREKNDGMFEFTKIYEPKLMLTVGASTFPLEDFLKINPSELFNI